MRHTEATGEWDGVDMATAPYLQDHVGTSGGQNWYLTSPFGTEKKGASLGKNAPSAITEGKSEFANRWVGRFRAADHTSSAVEL